MTRANTADWAENWKADNLTDDVARLIGQSQYDLWHGPCQEDDYPGFETACRTIRAALVDIPSQVYFDVDSGDWTEDEPTADPCDECDAAGCKYCNGEGWIAPMGDWTIVNRPALINAIVGRELAEYVR